MASVSVKKFNRNQVTLDFPNDFLCINSSDQERQINMDHEASLALHHSNECGFASNFNVKGRLVITVNEAKLVKNYGVTRMDPYVRLRIGHQIYETKTCYNGAKNPRWNRIFLCFLPNGVNMLHIEIFDECAFTVDEKIAWADYHIPSQIFEGETVETWIPLSGKQGEGKEGEIAIVLSFTPQRIMRPNAVTPEQIILGQTAGVQAPVGVVIKEEEVDQLSEMFPNIEKTVIRTVLESARGNQERAVNNLFQMTND